MMKGSNKDNNEKKDCKNMDESLINMILNNNYAGFFLIFGTLFSIIYFLLRLNPGNIVNTFPNIFFWLFFIATIIASSLYYFIIIYKKDRGNIFTSHDPNEKQDDSPKKDSFCSNKKGKYFMDFERKKTWNDFKRYIMSPLKILLGLILFFTIISTIIYFMLKYQIITQVLNIIVISLIVIVSLALIWSYLTNQIKEAEKGKSYWGFIVDFIFFIPCLFIEFLEYLKRQFNITTSTTWILLTLEVIFILFYFLLPLLAKQFATKGGDILLKDPIYTNNEKTLGSTAKDANYSIGVQLWINPQPSNTNYNYTKFTSLFNYGNRPNILYNGKTNVLKIVIQTDKNDLVTIYKTKDFPYQTWMNFIIIFRSGRVDVFLDNKLVGSLEGVMPYFTSNKITAGTKDGINGGIQNVIYFDRILNKNEIIWVD